jgi:hypothetical protein
MEAVYYYIGSYEAGIQNTGSRSANYHCYCEIYDKDMNPIKDHPLKDVFYGKWRKCGSVIKKWQKALIKAKLMQKNIQNTCQP